MSSRKGRSTSRMDPERKAGVRACSNPRRQDERVIGRQISIGKSRDNSRKSAGEASAMRCRAGKDARHRGWIRKGKQAFELARTPAAKTRESLEGRSRSARAGTTHVSPLARPVQCDVEQERTLDIADGSGKDSRRSSLLEPPPPRRESHWKADLDRQEQGQLT